MFLARIREKHSFYTEFVSETSKYIHEIKADRIVILIQVGNFALNPRMNSNKLYRILEKSLARENFHQITKSEGRNSQEGVRHRPQVKLHQNKTQGVVGEWGWEGSILLIWNIENR